MKPLFFGSSKAPLFGLYHPAAGKPRDVGVVVCNPFGQEAIRAHRALRQLAALLVRARFHVFRFDWSGTGDSAGSDVSLAAWRKDVATASDELRDTAGVRKVAWVGLRLGATVALLAADRTVDRVVAWDPVVRGRDYLAELARMHGEYMKFELPRWQPSGDGEALGFALPPSLKSELAAIEPTSFAPAAKRVAVVASEPGPRILRERLEKATWHDVPASAWNSEAAMASSIVPMDALRAIVAELEEGKA